MTDREDATQTALPAGVAPFPWHVQALAQLAGQRERLPHALLFTGPGGIGKRALALALGQALLCEAPLPAGLACGQCPGCRFVASRQHPDLVLLEPVEYDEDHNATPVEWIVIDRIREVTQFVQITSHRGGPKVVIIAPAERMNAAAANALLKTLEEPPPRTYIMLVSDQPRRIPVTLTSRCRRVPLARPAPAPAIEWLAAQRVASPELMLAQAGGAPLLALALADAEVQRERSFWLSALSQPARLAPVQLAAQIDAIPRDARRMLLARVVDWLIAWCGDIAALRAGSRDLRNPDHTAALGTLAGAVAPLPLFRYHRALLGQRALLSHPLQPRLVAEALLIEYRTLFT